MAMIGTVIFLSKSGEAVARSKQLLEKCRYGYRELAVTCEVIEVIGAITLPIPGWALDGFRGEFQDPSMPNRVFLDPVIALLCPEEYFELVADLTPWLCSEADCDEYPYALHYMRDLRTIANRLDRDSRERIHRELLA